MKIKVHKMEQENTRLEGLVRHKRKFCETSSYFSTNYIQYTLFHMFQVMRLESQVKRYKSQAEAAVS